jgi:hypothetical protein
MFKSDALIKEHQRGATPCKVREDELTEGFDDDQEKQLKSRKGMKGDLTEVEKWNRVYSILFPDDDPEEMPTPCT